MKADEFPWDAKDVLRVIRHVAEPYPYREDYHSCDYCIHCGSRIGNVKLACEQGAQENSLHEPDCMWVLAKDMLTGISHHD